MMKSSHSAMNLSRIRTERIEEKQENGHEHKEQSNGKEHDHKVNIDVLKYNKIPDISKLIPASHIYSAYKKMRHLIKRTPCYLSSTLSEKFQAKIYLKREDLQVVRSYKIRGAYNKISSLSQQDLAKGVVCASAGNHAQGVAYVCELLKINATIFMPTTTPAIKLNAVKSMGKQYSNIIITGDTYDDSFKAASIYCKENSSVFVPAFDDDKAIEGQGTMAVEILEDIQEESIDFVFFPVGGGGCGSGISSYFKQMSPNTILIGCEPQGSPSMKNALDTGIIEELKTVNTFVDGAAIQKAGTRTYEILSQCLRQIHLVAEGHICTIMMKMFNEEGILIEPAGALALAGLDQFTPELKGRTVVCILSGSNNDLGRMQDIRLLSEMHRGLQYYMLVNFYMKSGALKQFLSDCLTPIDEITNIEYTKKNNRERGPALVGLKVQHPSQMEEIKRKMDLNKITYRFLSPDQEVFKLLL